MKIPRRYVIKTIQTPEVSEGYEDRPIDSPERVAAFWRGVVARESDYEDEKERLVVLVLSAKLRLRGYHVVSVGTLSETCAHPREILRPVILLSGYAMVLIHNHPSGDPSPSQADLRLTRQIREAAELLQIPLQDHVIVGRGGNYYSFREAGMI